LVRARIRRLSRTTISSTNAGVVEEDAQRERRVDDGLDVPVHGVDRFAT